MFLNQIEYWPSTGSGCTQVVANRERTAEFAGRPLSENPSPDLKVHSNTPSRVGSEMLPPILTTNRRFLHTGPLHGSNWNSSSALAVYHRPL